MSVSPWSEGNSGLHPTGCVSWWQAEAAVTRIRDLWQHAFQVRGHAQSQTTHGHAPFQPPLPKIALVLGSGLGGFADRLRDAVVIPYDDMPGFPVPTVSGHQGHLHLGTLGTPSAPVAVFQGRCHYYEGYTLDQVTFPIRVLQAWGAQIVILTASVGGIRADLAPGDLVLIRDHLNLLGGHPLRGPHDPRFGARFPDMTTVYPSALRELAKAEAARLEIPLSEGVYACMPGPGYETPAEVLMLRALGADVVGMSTVPEAIVARQGGLNVLGLTLVTNTAAGLGQAQPLDHEDVLAVGNQAAHQIGDLCEALLPKLATAVTLSPSSP